MAKEGHGLPKVLPKVGQGKVGPAMSYLSKLCGQATSKVSCMRLSFTPLDTAREGREMPEFGLLSWIPLRTYFLHGLGPKQVPCNNFGP
jgi:hypothetical protein